MRVLIIGCGYVGASLGAALARHGHEVLGLRRRASRNGELQAAGIQPVDADITQPADLRTIPGTFDWVVLCVSTGGGGSEDYRRVYLEGMRHVLAWLSPKPPARFIYTSSTSVYGQTEGSEVNEESPTEPGTETGKILLNTEQVLLEEARNHGFPAVILRLSGIYGLGRGYWLQRALRGDWPAQADSGRILNQIHRDDVVGCLQAALQRGRSGSIYNATDDEPISQNELLRWLSGSLGRTPSENPSGGQGSGARGTSSKRVSNRKLKQELGYRFIYPTFREGYEAELSRLRPQG